MNITQCSQSKTAFQTVTSEGPAITTFGFVTDCTRIRPKGEVRDDNVSYIQ